MKKKTKKKKLDFNTNFKPGDYLQFSIQGRVGGAKEHKIGNDRITVLFRWTQKPHTTFQINHPPCPMPRAPNPLKSSPFTYLNHRICKRGQGVISLLSHLCIYLLKFRAEELNQSNPNFSPSIVVEDTVSHEDYREYLDWNHQGSVGKQMAHMK